MTQRELIEAEDAVAERIRLLGSAALTRTPARVQFAPRERRLVLPSAPTDHPRELVSATLMSADCAPACPALEGVGYTREVALTELERHCHGRLGVSDRVAALAVIARVRTIASRNKTAWDEQLMDVEVVPRVK